jgi:UDP-N-acetylmuramyl pentapeptide synthase
MCSQSPLMRCSLSGRAAHRPQQRPGRRVPAPFAFDTKEEVVEVLHASLGSGDVLLAKASLGLALGAVVTALIG